MKRVAVPLLAASTVILGGLFLAVDSYVRLRTTSTFRQHLAVIGPVITDQEMKQLLSSWASMRNRNDYDALVNEMHRIAQVNKITLPENKLYPWPP